MFVTIKAYLRYKLNSFKIKQKYKSVLFERSTKYDSQTIFGDYNKLFSRVNVCSSTIGKGTYIAHDSALYNSRIGAFCSIGPNVSIIRGQHPTKQFVSTHPAFFSQLKNDQAGFTFVQQSFFADYRFVDEDKKILISIGNDVWIGSNVLLLEGVTIGDGAIVGAGSLVTKNLEPYGIYGGVPAKLIRKRFSDEQIDYLLSLKWWDKDFEWIKANADKFRDIDKFINETNVND